MRIKLTQETKRVCYNCGSTKTYISPSGSAQWYSYKKKNWLCSKCRAKLFNNPKWHPIYRAKRSDQEKEEMRILARHYSRIHGRVKKELRMIPLSNQEQFALRKEYKTLRVRDLRADYTTPAIDTLLKSIKKIERDHHDWQPEYDREFFNIARSRLVLENSEKDPSLYSILDFLTDEEKPAMIEALECATNGYLRASIVLGWAAAIYRMHRVVEKMGFDVFTKKSQEMVQSQVSHFKHGKAVNTVRNMSDLEANVPDGNLLWVLEYCEIIDSNQHKRLEGCSIFRNTSAHPNSTKITRDNVKSFYSDLKNLVFENPKFGL